MSYEYKITRHNNDGPVWPPDARTGWRIRETHLAEIMRSKASDSGGGTTEYANYDIFALWELYTDDEGGV